ncbi:MAG: two-component system, response regulator PdtaR [Thermodesulfobacteriota bacterium]|nr:two-component system, response regulator PdtaR [Thermodesulfobacteriota bacterium]
MSMKPGNGNKMSEDYKTTSLQEGVGSDRIMSEDEKVYMKKFEQLLETTRSICHELSQPITVISGYSELLLLKKTEKDQQYERLLEIKKQADIIDGTIRRLRNVVKYSTSENGAGNDIIGG